MAANRENGFTLVELIVVVSIIAILLGIAIPSFIANRAKATLVACQSDARYVYQAVTAYNMDTGGIPTATVALLTAGDTPYLQPVPVPRTSCAISIDNGVVMLAAPATATPIAYDPTSVASGGSAAAGIGTTTVASGTTTTAAASTTTTAPTVPTTTATTTATTVASSTTTAVTVAPLGAPTGVTATCYSPTDKKVTVRWTAVPRAASYSVVDSTVSASSGFVEIASYVAGTSFTTGGLGYSTRWFQVIAHLGTTASVNSATSNSLQITNAPGCM